MNFSLEEQFVTNYINKEYQDRLLFELKSSKKRQNGVLRFSHNATDLLKKGKIQLTLESFDQAKLQSFLQEIDYYVISTMHRDGATMSKKQVIHCLEEDFGPVIVCGVNIAIVKKEQESGTDNYFLLQQ